MQTVEQPPAGPGATPPEPSEVRLWYGQDPPPDDLQLLFNWSRDPDSTLRFRAAAVGTVVVHLLLILGLAEMPHQNSSRFVNERPRIITKLWDPPIELTQKTPNRGKVSKEIVVQLPAAPSIPVPKPAPAAETRKFIPPVPQPEKPKTAAPSILEPPKIEQAQNTPQITLPQLPQIQPQDGPPSDVKPKLPFENIGGPPKPPSGQARIPVPGTSVGEAVRELSHGGNTGASGSETFNFPGSRPNMPNMPPSPGRPRIDYDLKFDPQGVDFKPYIARVLAIISRNWFAVYPESAKLGTRGQVKLEFAIAKDGTITKVAFSWQSGTQALDHAAVAAISASNPLPALPSEFRGDRIVLAFTFSYNLAR